MIADRVSTTCLRLHPSVLANSNRFVCNMTVWRECTKKIDIEAVSQTQSAIEKDFI